MCATCLVTAWEPVRESIHLVTPPTGSGLLDYSIVYTCKARDTDLYATPMGASYVESH